MFSTEGDIVQVYVWSRATNLLKPVSERGIDIGYTEITSPNGEVGPLIWKDEQRLITGFLPLGEAGTVLDRDRGVERFSSAQWTRAKRGYETTSSSVQSPLRGVSRRESIAVVDISRGTVQEIAVVPSVGRRWIRIAPDWRKGVVVTQTASAPMQAGLPLRPDYRTQIGVFSLSIPGIRWNESQSITAVVRWEQGAPPVVSTRDKELYSFDLDSASLRPVSEDAVTTTLAAQMPVQSVSPLPRGEVLATSATRVVIKIEDEKGIRLLTCAAPTPCDEVIRLNPRIANIQPASMTLIDYTSSTGVPLKAVVIKPPGYQAGKAYPTIFWVYAGLVVKSVNDVQASLANTRWDNPQLLAARGYVVVFPSIPLQPYGAASDPYSDMSGGVMPAVEKVIATGIADPKRLGITGHSYGGYTTVALLSQTKVFRSAIALAGIYDLTSFYGQFDPHDRYAAGISRLDFPGVIEISQFRMGAPPWDSSDRYLRNSPVTYLKNIGARLMLVAGELDPAMAQSEEIFTGLQRLGKPVTLVRYFGESHTLNSPANIRDLWRRIFEWFDESLST